MFSIFTKKIELDFQEFCPHDKSILVWPEWLEVRSENANNFFQKRMIFVLFDIHNLFLKSLA